MPSYSKILNFLMPLREGYSVKRIAESFDCKPDQVRPVLHRMHQSGFLKKTIINNHVLWQVSDAFRNRFYYAQMKYRYQKPSEMLIFREIQKKRDNHRGFCQICLRKHAYPHQAYPYPTKRKRGKNLTQYIQPITVTYVTP